MITPKYITRKACTANCQHTHGHARWSKHILIGDSFALLNTPHPSVHGILESNCTASLRVLPEPRASLPLSDELDLGAFVEASLCVMSGDRGAFLTSANENAAFWSPPKTNLERSGIVGSSNHLCPKSRTNNKRCQTKHGPSPSAILDWDRKPLYMWACPANTCRSTACAVLRKVIQS